jgi:excisionase family DNA binding protein
MPIPAQRSIKTTTKAERAWRTVKEAAGELDITEDVLRKWVESGRIRALQPGGPRTQVRILLAELERVKRRERGAA